MVEFDEGAQAFRVAVDKVVNGKRIRKTKTLPNGSTFDMAQRVEALILDKNFTFKERLLIAVDGVSRSAGHVYAVKNEYLPGIVKIGMTSGPVRARILNLSSALPSDFQLVHSVYVNHALAIEQAIHAHFSKHRINRNREFFRLTEEEVTTAMNLAYEVDGVDMSSIIESIGRKPAVSGSDTDN